ncbi:MAG: hypothetical protein AB8H79_08940 [Myxococcota bacterium]
MDLDLPDRWSDAAPQLLPVLRGPTSPANAWTAALDREDAVSVRQPIVDNLDIAVVLDLPELRLFVNRSHLNAWGASEAAVLQQALQNVPPTTGLEPWDIPGIWSLNAGDGYDSSRVALPGWLAAFRDRVSGTPVAVVPDARTLLITGSEAGEATQALISEGWNRFHSAGTPVCLAPLSVDDNGELTPWLPSLSHPLVHRVQACHRFFAAHEYRRQQDPLERWLFDRRDPHYLAEISMLRHKTGRVVTFAVLPKGPTLLPKVDLVVLGPVGSRNLADHPCVPWRELVEAGVITEPEPGLRPERFRVADYPATWRGLATVDPAAYQPPT